MFLPFLPFNFLLCSKTCLCILFSPSSSSLLFFFFSPSFLLPLLSCCLLASPLIYFSHFPPLPNHSFPPISSFPPTHSTRGNKMVLCSIADERNDRFKDRRMDLIRSKNTTNVSKQKTEFTWTPMTFTLSPSLFLTSTLTYTLHFFLMNICYHIFLSNSFTVAMSDDLIRKLNQEFGNQGYVIMEWWWKYMKKKWFGKILFHHISESGIYGYYSIILISYIIYIVYERMQIHWSTKNRERTFSYLYFIHYTQESRYTHILIHISNQKGKGNRNMSKIKK